MPVEIMNAIREARAGQQGSINDDTWRERLAERFGSRWRILKYRVSANGQQPMTAEARGTQLKRRPKKKAKRRNGRGGGQGAISGNLSVGRQGGAQLGDRKSVTGGLPIYRWVSADELRPGILAAWMPNDPESPEGVVLLNSGHPVIQDQVEHWQGQYAPHLADEVRDEVQKVYGEVAVAKVAHSEHMRSLMPDAADVDDKLRSEESLTMALLGLIAEESMIATRVGGKLGQHRRVSA